MTNIFIFKNKRNKNFHNLKIRIFIKNNNYVFKNN